MSTVKRYDEMTNGQTKAVISKMGGVKVVMAFLRGEYIFTKVTTAVASALLTLIGTVTLPATTGKFVAKEKFMINTECNAERVFRYLSDNFNKWFLNGDGKIEDPISEQTLRYHKLEQSLVGSLIIEGLGGEAKAETTLSEMFALMEKQKNREVGVLLNNGRANIFYIRDQNGVLRSVCVYWRGTGWCVHANSVEAPDGWGAVNRVFSRN